LDKGILQTDFKGPENTNKPLAETNVLSTNHSSPVIKSESEISKSNNSEVNKNENKPILMNMNSSKKERNDWSEDKTSKIKNKKNKLAMENTGH